MRRDFITSAIAVIAFTIMLGLVYPLLMTGIAQVAFPNKANGSQVEVAGKVVGSKLIGQDFKGNPRYFQSRPSTATSYAGDASAFTNLGPNSRTARDTFRKSLEVYLTQNPGTTASQVPIDAVTSSASGVDPQISVANARIQAHRVARARNLPLATVDNLIDKHTSGRFIGIFGEPAVNVLELNLALDGVTQ